MLCRVLKTLVKYALFGMKYVEEEDRREMARRVEEYVRAREVEKRRGTFRVVRGEKR